MYLSFLFVKIFHGLYGKKLIGKTQLDG